MKDPQSGRKTANPQRREMIEITCADCGANRTARIRTTKYCRLCRFARDLEAYANPQTLDGKMKDCYNCNDSFLPVSRGDSICGPCTVAPLRRRGVCVNCNQPDSHLVHDEVPFCATCARSRENRLKLWACVAELVRAKAARYRATAPAAPPSPPSTLLSLQKEAKLRFPAEEIQARLRTIGTELKQQNEDEWRSLSQDDRLLLAYKELLA